MKHGILKRVIALCIAGGVMALTLAACGDSENNNEGEETVLDVSQGSEDGTVDVAKNEETDTANSPSNDVRVAHASSSGNSGNGFAIPMFKPGEEPDSGQELQSGKEPQSGADSQPGRGTQQPQQPQQSSTGNPTAHTHNWVTQTIHHDATGHNESRVIGTEEVRVSHKPAYQDARCSICGAAFGIFDYSGSEDRLMMDIAKEHEKETGHLSIISDILFDDVYETRDIIENVWVQDSAAWDENITTCSTCGAKQ